MNDQVLDETKVQELVGYLKVAVLVVLVFAVGAAGYFFVKEHRDRASLDAYSALYRAEKVEEAAIKEAEALKSDVTELILKWPEAKRKELEASYLKVAHEHPDTVAGLSAQLRAARWNFLEKNYAGAAVLYKEALANKIVNTESLLKAMAYEGLGAALEAQNVQADAAKTYADAIAMKDNPLRPLAYLGKARAEKALGKKKEAGEALDQLVKDYPGTTYERRARVLKALEG